jgi:hypothetical protein
MKGVKGAPKRKKDKETQAQRTAGDIAEADRAEVREKAAPQISCAKNKLRLK